MQSLPAEQEHLRVSLTRAPLLSLSSLNIHEINTFETCLLNLIEMGQKVLGKGGDT